MAGHLTASNINPTIDLSATPLDQLEYFYKILREKQFKLLEKPIPPTHRQFKQYCDIMKIFYNGKLIALQTHLYNDQNRDYILREILQLTINKIIQYYPTVTDPWSTSFN